MNGKKIKSLKDKIYGAKATVKVGAEAKETKKTKKK
jgi:hypothetical protein